MKGSRVMAYRQHLGMTQEELADALGVRSTTVSRWEQERVARPPMLELALLRLMDERRQLTEEMLTRPLREDVEPATRPGRPAKGVGDGELFRGL